MIWKNWPAPNVWVFIAQLVRALQAMGWNPVEVPKFFFVFSLVQSIHLSYYYIKIVSLLCFHLLLHVKYSISFARNRDSKFFSVWRKLDAWLKKSHMIESMMWILLKRLTQRLQTNGQIWPLNFQDCRILKFYVEKYCSTNRTLREYCSKGIIWMVTLWDFPHGLKS